MLDEIASSIEREDVTGSLNGLWTQRSFDVHLHGARNRHA
jgi:hypothetical protein